MRKAIVDSREYKVMLRAYRFAGDERRCLQTASQFWQDLKQHIKSVVLNVDGNLTDITRRRIITFYDTPQRVFHRHHYIFRERYDLKTHAREVTLKFRHPDRYLAEAWATDVQHVSGKYTHEEWPQPKTKFEEDIKLPFVPLYSVSTTSDLAPSQTMDGMHQIASHYPGLRQRLGKVTRKEVVHVVGSPMQEIVIEGASFQLRRTPRRDATCALIVWSAHADEEDRPALVEFSFRYGDARAEYTMRMAQRAYDVFDILRTTLTQWVDPISDTKTAYMYR